MNEDKKLGQWVGGVVGNKGYSPTREALKRGVDPRDIYSGKAFSPPAKKPK